MTPINIIKTGLVVTLLLGSIYNLIRKNRIPNWLTFSYILCGIILNTYNEEFAGLFFSLTGIFITFFILIIPFIFKILSGGDVKVALGIAAIKGPYFIFYSLIISFIIASCWYVLIKKGESVDYIRNAFVSIYYNLPINPNQENMPYLGCLFISCIIILLIENYLPTPFLNL